MTLALPGTTEAMPSRCLTAHQRRLGTAAGLFGGVGWMTWLSWRIDTLTFHVVPIVALAAEALGAIAGLVLTAALLRPPVQPVPKVVVADRTTAFPVAIGTHLGRPVIGNQAPGRGLAGAAVGAVLIEGPRRAAMVAVATAGLLLGVSPIPLPSLAAIVGLVLGVAGVSLAHVVLSAGTIALGDRTRWAFASQADLLGASDSGQLRRRRWTITVASAVVLSLGVALRGMSDRWTHGFDAMAIEPRAVALLLALSLALGALYTLATTDPPEPSDADTVARRHDERTTRQPALAGAVLVGVIGLVAGLLPGGVDAADHDPAGVEQVSQREPRVAADD